MLELTRGEVRVIRLKGQRLEYRVRRSASVKRRRLEVSPAGVLVTLPKNDPIERASAFIRENGAWVIQETAALARRAQVFRAATTATTVLVRGAVVDVEVTKVRDTRSTRVEFDGQTLRMTIPVGANASVKLEAWLRSVARAEIAATVARHAPTMGVEPMRVFIRGQRTKWGNCSRLRNLSFNWRLAMVPPEVLDYLVVHELVHLQDMSHSQRFWLLVRQSCPTYARHQQWLRTNAHRLVLPKALPQGRRRA
jgi:predicted metal-dependent hydrolase